jgi:hypothetical protein
LFSPGSFSDSNVVGTFFRIVESFTSAPVSSARYFSRSHAAAAFCAFDGIPTTSPPIKPAPYRSDLSSTTGNGAVA